MDEPTPNPPLWKRSLRIVLPLALLLGCWAAFQFGGDDLRQMHQRLGWVAPVVTVPLHALIAAAPVPSDVIVIANGALYSYPVAVFLGWLGWLLGSILEFTTIRLWTGVNSEEEARKKMPRWISRWPAGSPWFLFFGRQIPGVGAHLCAGVAAAGGVSYRRYITWTAIAIVPGALLLSAIGARLLGEGI
ncbi:TVP38/TMEM64 family protein [Rhodopirellula halodulae]|uniref:TVP38/TMEM64 family protein n=1 Tax=Rhodopirellula halodulae TaxID=2894198 RepID=UPI001E61FD8F|nr:VTT domain-containing protein [Rhodopirellula sp. JC737]MCC9658893.1 VTT domain-containing protein [Rhodopirellula sp. JC737]